ncbi:MAG: hypothetical protein ACT4OZ_01935 [Gemmatimonadota bacterium]
MIRRSVCSLMVLALGGHGGNDGLRHASASPDSASHSTLTYLRQQGTERRLAARPEVELEEPFSEITSVRELADGRLIVLDGREQTIQLIDPGRGSAQAIGRRGEGPGEYGRATALLAWRGDSTIVTDGANRRLLFIDASGRPGRVMQDQPGSYSPSLSQGSDRVGHLYGRVIAAAGIDPTRPPDSTTVGRFTLDSGRVAVLARVALPNSQITISRGANNEISRVEVARIPFAVGDEISVAPDGRLAIARRDPYRLEQIFPGGRRVSGPVIRFAEIPLRQAEREEHLATLPPGARRSAEALPWPRVLPPFPPRSVIALSSGETLVRRHRPAGAAIPYDVFDAAGRRLAALVLTKDQRLVAVTSRGTYVARTDADGLQYLGRYPPLF